jgi:hypothetical protein
MKLGFISHKQDIHKEFGREITIHRYVIADKKQEAKSYENQGFTKVFNRAWQLAELLQSNDNFIKFIKEMRNPKSALFHLKREYEDYLPKEWKFLHPSEVIKTISNYPKSRSAIYALSDYDIDKEITIQLPTIIYFNSIFLPIVKPDIEIISHDNKSVCIQISSDITPNTLREYIDDNQEEFNKKVSALSRKSFLISNRDLYIYNERDRKNEKKKIPFSEITARVSKKFGAGGKKETNTTEATIKTAYRRAKEKIHSIFRKKKH